MNNDSDLGYAILFRGGQKLWGADAYDVLQQLRGGWNPDSVDELKISLARRAGIYDKEVITNMLCLSDEEYIDVLVSRDFWVMKRVPMSVVEKNALRTSNAI
jgi:hypothetical protein